MQTHSILFLAFRWKYRVGGFASLSGSSVTATRRHWKSRNYPQKENCFASLQHTLDLRLLEEVADLSTLTPLLPKPIALTPS